MSARSSQQSALPPGSVSGSARSYSKTSPMASPGRTRTATVTPLASARSSHRGGSNNNSGSTSNNNSGNNGASRDGGRNNKPSRSGSRASNLTAGAGAGASRFPENEALADTSTFINLQDVLAASPVRRPNPIEAVKAAGDEGPILVKVDKTSARRRRLVRQKKLRNKLCGGWILFLSLITLPTIFSYWVETSNTILLGRIEDLESNLAAETSARKANDTALITDLTSLDTQVTTKLQATELITSENARRLLELEVLTREHTGRIIVLETASADHELRVSTLEAAANSTDIDITRLLADSSEYRARITVLETQGNGLFDNTTFLLERDVNITTRTEDLEALASSNANRATNLETRATNLEATTATLTAVTDDHETRTQGLEQNMTDVRARALVLEQEMDTAQVDIINLETFQSVSTVAVGQVRRRQIMYTEHRVLSSHFGRVQQVVGLALPDGYIASGGANDLLVKVWDVMTGTEVTSKTSPGPVSALATSPANQLFSGTTNGTVVRWTWDPVAFTLEKHSSYQAHFTLSGPSSVNRLIVLPNQDLLSCGSDNILKIWTTGAIVTQLATLVGHTLSVIDMAVIDDSDTIVSGDSGGTMIIWKAKSSAGHVVLPHPGVSTSVVAIVALARDRVAAAFADGNIRVYNVFTELQEATYSTTSTLGTLSALNVLADESIISGHSNGVLAVWDSEDGSVVAQRQTASAGEITSVTTLSDGTIVSSDVADVIVWRNGFTAPAISV